MIQDVSSDTEVGKHFWGLKLARDQVISFWICNIPTFPHYRGSGSATFQPFLTPAVLTSPPALTDSFFLEVLI